MFQLRAGCWKLICSLPVYLSFTCAAGRGASGCDPSWACTVLLHPCSAACCSAGSGTTARTADHHVYDYYPARTDHHCPASARAGERWAAFRGFAVQWSQLKPSTLSCVMCCSILSSLLRTVNNNNRNAFSGQDQVFGYLGNEGQLGSGFPSWWFTHQQVTVGLGSSLSITIFVSCGCFTGVQSLLGPYPCSPCRAPPWRCRLEKASKYR